MKKLFGIAVCVALVGCMGLLAADKGPPAKAVAPALQSNEEKAGYCIGLSIGKDLRSREIGPKGLGIEALCQGIRDGLAGKKSRLSNDEMRKVSIALGREMAKREQLRAERAKLQGQSNVAAGKAFLAANKAKPGVKTLPSGLQYLVIKPGTGKKPTAEDTVEVHYRGTLLDGTEFDSSIRRGQAAVFQLKGVIPGWREGVALMKEGAKYKLFVPPDLAYGPRGAGRLIGPNATLIFEVELIKVK